MPHPRNMPFDKQSAREIMKNFSEMAYVTSHKDFFEEAIHILYGEDFIVKLDLSKRMMFYCKLCSKDMNSETAVAQHTQSGSHQKNLDRKCREERNEASFPPIKYHKDLPSDHSNSLQSMLITSSVKPVGLQMIEEYQRAPGTKRYYKCNLCGAHGKLEPMYKHVIGNKHTERYIKTRVALKNSILTAKEREYIREFLIRKEGMSVSYIKTYQDKWLYPSKWENCNKYGPQPNKLETQGTLPQTSQPQTSQSPGICKRACSSSPDRPSKFPHYMYRNKSPPSVNAEIKTGGDEQAQSSLQPKEPVITQDQFSQKYDLEELMTQLNFIVKTSHLPEFDIHNEKEAKETLDMMFKISSALYSITKNSIENSTEMSQQNKDDLNCKKNLLSKIMGSIKRRMEVALSS